jgi:hypothetical protein
MIYWFKRPNGIVWTPKFIFSAFNFEEGSLSSLGGKTKKERTN